MELSLIMERLVKAEQFEAKMKVKVDEEEKFKFKSASGCKKQFKFNLRLKDGFVGDLKSELENCFDKVLPEGVGSLMKKAEKAIDDRNLKLKIGDEFGLVAMEEFGEEDLARNKEEERKLKVFRKEKEARELKAGGALTGFRSETAGGRGSRWRERERCFSCLEVGHFAAECGKQGSRRGSRGTRR